MVWVGPIEGLGDEASLSSLDRARRELAFGASAYQGDADISTPTTALSFLPIGLGYFLLAPAPWQVWNTRQLLALPEMLAWYAVLPQVVAGFLIAIRRRFGAALPLASFALFGTLSYALVESNLGTAYRHRAQVLVLFLVFGAIGLAERKAAASQRALPKKRRRRCTGCHGTDPGMKIGLIVECAVPFVCDEVAALRRWELMSRSPRPSGRAQAGARPLGRRLATHSLDAGPGLCARCATV